jgi:hypothetical protein
MSTIPIQVGHTIAEKFILIDAANAAVTGKVQADFTIKISNGSTGNISTTGLTITEVSAVNDPGHYALAVSGTTGFHATTTGEFTVEIYLTTDVGSRVAMTFLVTSDGDFSGTSGAASFTATAANGRITDGASALASATIRIRSSVNQIYAQTTSSVLGLWGPVYFADAGTYTLDVQKTGYTTSSTFTITVSGSTATLSSASDIALTVATSSSGLTASDLWAYARRMARNKTGTQADTEIKQAVNDALDMISQEAEWPWLLTDRGTFSLDAAYATGTVAIAVGATTMTLTSGTWPTWAASGKLKIAGKTYFISSRTSGSVIELATAWKATALTATTFIIFRDEYALASDLMKFGRIHPGETWAWGGQPMGFDTFLDLQNDHNFSLDYPAGWTIAGNKIRMWPYPGTDNLVNYSYYKKPAALAQSTDEADWDPCHVLLLRLAINYQIALRYEDCPAGDPKACLSAYQTQLAKSKPMNKNPMSLPAVGSSGRGRRVDPGDFILPPNV